MYKNPPDEPVKVACCNIEVEPTEKETHTGIAQLPEEILEVKSLIVGDAAKDMKGRDPKKKKTDRAKAEIKSGDKVMLFHERSNMFAGSKGTRWSGPYLVTRVLQVGRIELWHKNSGKFKVQRHMLKLEIEPDPVRVGSKDPSDLST